MKERVFLVGFMGVGKTSLGKKLANKLHYEFIDTDMLIEKKMGISVNEVFQLHGETHFRKLEKELLDELGDKKNVVVSTGGGLPCFNHLMDVLLHSGLVIWLDVPEHIILSRVQNAKEERPLLKNKTDKELIQYINEKLTERSEVYSRAHIRFENMSVNAEKIAQLLHQIKMASI